MTRSAKLGLGHITKKKRREIAALLEAYRAAVNFYAQSLWFDFGKLDKATLARLPSSHTRLSERFKSQALKQAMEIVISTKRAAKALGRLAGIPVFSGNAVLDAKFVTLEEGRESFGLVIKLSTLDRGHRVVLPIRKTKVLNKWLARPGATLVQGVFLNESYLTVSIKMPDESPKEGRVLGIDLGVNKLVSISDGNHLGREFRPIRDKIRRRKPGSKGRQRAFAERTNYIGRTLNQLPWADLNTLGIEALHDMKRGKKPNRSKAFRRALAPWVYRQVLTRIGHKAQENRVRLVSVDPKNTSRTCPAPGCGTVSKDSRRGEDFVCVSCGHTADADTVGAQNVLARTLLLLGSVESPRQS